ncbi:hypothetical protein S40285_04483 [Stachybotrys chlorohalonatus IBT 40285]|uniref:Uncharacterized protein n=2 Tax=Stachybotrys TaxID=74721 RepID=A0A084QIR9_STAC4|nr:hypothetical protein S7711_00115 [Stachybotrys chartarum IBT 7711]KFA52130.1 hypothetical protein S40293_00512 [Stachybotrys chartarum IBT 40293]KFA63854.1 hypothetical protein S40285_04483 [Stachybotrys chlorohalonata IBT 40285]KFA77220.1 hypothetical protein S40288_01252 [Stachybotrys chartarum IBT 40288]
MDFHSLIRPVARVLNTTRSTVNLTATRGHKTTARTKRALKIAPHDSFLPDRSAAFPAGDSIIYNPPASEASPFHTPFIFLPPNDPRREALVRMRENPGAPSNLASKEADLSPEMKYHRRTPRYHLTAEHIQEMRRLRNEDPLQWSVGRLAKKFDCSPIFVQMAAPASREHLQWLKEKLERKQERWGPMKTQAREERKARAEMMYRGEL